MEGDATNANLHGVLAAFPDLPHCSMNVMSDFTEVYTATPAVFWFLCLGIAVIIVYS